MAATRIERSAAMLNDLEIPVALMRPERFCFTASSARRAAALSRPRSTPIRGRERVLIVDERPHLAAISATMLSDLGHSARWCLDGRDALDRLAQGEPVDLLVLPLVTASGDDGATLARAAQRLQPGLRVLLTSGSSRTGMDREAPPPYEVLAKPYGQAKLGMKVRQLLDSAAQPL